MKTLIRLIALASVTLATSNFCLANWYNHPVCTTAGVILKWHSTYTDFNHSDFTSQDAPGGTAIPPANLRGIVTTDSTIIYDSHHHSTHVRGGSFPVWQGVNHTTIRGWINVTVKCGTNDTTILSSSWNYTPSGSGSGHGPQYPNSTDW